MLSSIIAGVLVLYLFNFFKLDFNDTDEYLNFI